LCIDQIGGALREGVAEDHGIQLSAVVLLRQGGIPRTTSGKIRRTECREAYRTGTLDALEAPAELLTVTPAASGRRD
jgi:acyl-CoA synthetase (AMP-forming)/AMP-acid ligase II